MNLQARYQRLGASTCLDDRQANAIVAQATPHALAALGRSRIGTLPVSVRRVSPDIARGGSLIPAWPMLQADGSVVIEYVEDWGAMLATWISTVEEPLQSRAEELAKSGQRLWIGIGNDVLQLFVVDPPAGTYSMVRHHALMLAAATAWLGPDAMRAWQELHGSAAAQFLKNGRHLWKTIEAAEHGLDRLLEDARAHQTAPLALAWLDADDVNRARYVDYLGAASLGVAAVLHAMPDSHAEAEAWLIDAVANLHADPEFNRAWIEEAAWGS